jgi:hypothetical protein
MNFVGNTDINQESDVFRAMSARLRQPQGQQHQKTTGVRQTPQPPPQRPQQQQQQQKPQSPKPGSQPPDVGSMGVYVLSAGLLGATWLLSRNRAPPQEVSQGLPSSISIGGINLDI